MAKHVLGSSGNEFDFGLLGITSADDQYRTISLINDALNASFYLSDYIPLNLKKGQVFRFSLYRWSDEALGLDYYFVPNLSNFEPPGNMSATADLFQGLDVDESTRLIKELPKTEYFLIIKGELHEHYKFRVLSVLRNLPAFGQVQVIEAQDLASKRNLIF